MLDITGPVHVWVCACVWQAPSACVSEHERWVTEGVRGWVCAGCSTSACPSLWLLACQPTACRPACLPLLPQAAGTSHEYVCPTTACRNTLTHDSQGTTYLPRLVHFTVWGCKAGQVFLAGHNGRAASQNLSKCVLTLCSVCSVQSVGLLGISTACLFPLSSIFHNQYTECRQLLSLLIGQCVILSHLPPALPAKCRPS